MDSSSRKAEVGRRDRKKLVQRRNIIHETMKAFKQYGFHQITMEQIAELSDISKATLYKYFPVKEAIIAAYWQEEMENTSDEFESLMTNNEDTKSRLVALLHFFMTRIMESRELYEIYIKYRTQNLYDENKNESLRSGAEAYVTRIIQEGQKNLEIKDDVPTQILVSNFEMISVMQAMIWLRQPESFSLELTSTLLVDLFLNGAANHEK